MKTSTIFLILASTFLVGFVFQTPSSSMTQQAPMITHMTGNEHAVWLSTSNNELVYCWWKSDPDRTTEQAQCRTLDRWKVNFR